MIFVTVSTGHFDPLIQMCESLKKRWKFFGQIGCGTFVPSFPYARHLTPFDLDKKMKEAEIVITHGGTGMLSRLYHLKRPTLIIPKQMRYGESNDSQVELAMKWAELKMGILCMDIEMLAEKIELCRTAEFNYPIFPSLGTALKLSLSDDTSSVANPITS